MDDRECWQLIRLGRVRAYGRIVRPADVVAAELAARPVGDVLAFNRWFRERMLDAHRGEILVAARWVYAAHGAGEVSVDGWEYLRAWLVGRGRKTFAAVLADADALADAFTDAADFGDGEPLKNAAEVAYGRVTGGQEPPDAFYEPAVEDMTPAAVPEDAFTAEQLIARFPKLAARFGPPKFR
jgi:hypothetical protein